MIIVKSQHLTAIVAAMRCAIEEAADVDGHRVKIDVDDVDLERHALAAIGLAAALAANQPDVSCLPADVKLISMASMMSWPPAPRSTTET